MQYVIIISFVISNSTLNWHRKINIIIIKRSFSLSCSLHRYTHHQARFHHICVSLTSQITCVMTVKPTRIQAKMFSLIINFLGRLKILICSIVSIFKFFQCIAAWLFIMDKSTELISWSEYFKKITLPTTRHLVLTSRKGYIYNLQGY